MPRIPRGQAKLRIPQYRRRSNKLFGNELLGVIFAVAFFILPHTALAQRTETVDITIAGGKTISARIAAGGPVPVEDERIQIKVAGMLIGPTSENNRDPGLIWNFSFRNKRAQPPMAVIVDDVTFDPIVTVLSDDKPALSRDTWSQTARPIAITKEALPWVFDSRPTMKVFRFTVRYADDEQSIVHQLALYSASAKETIRLHANKIRSGR